MFQDESEQEPYLDQETNVLSLGGGTCVGDDGTHADDNFFVRLTGQATTAKLEKTASSEQATGDGGGEDVAGLSTDEQENFCVQQCFKDEYETEDVDWLKVAGGGSTGIDCR